MKKVTKVFSVMVASVALAAMLSGYAQRLRRR